MVERVSADFEALNNNDSVRLFRDSALSMALYALVVQAGKPYMGGVAALLACAHWRLQDGEGRTKYRPLNAARQVASAMLMGYAGTFLYQGFRAIPSAAALQPIGYGLGCWAGAHLVRCHADKVVS